MGFGRHSAYGVFRCRRQKSLTEVVANDDVVCPWESQEPTAQTTQPTLPHTGTAARHPETQNTSPVVVKTSSSSEVTVNIMLNPSKQASPVISPAGGSTSSASSGSGHRRKSSASGLTVQQQPPESSTEQTAPPPHLDKSSSKISDICPWEDE